jgi:hypothetical protein
MRYLRYVESAINLSYSQSHSQEPAKATQTYSSVQYPTLGQTLPTLEYMINIFEAMVDNAHFQPVAFSLRKALTNAEKWYDKTDQSDAYFIVLGELLHFGPVILRSQ